MTAAKDDNPYAPPRDLEPARSADEPQPGLPASLGARAFAAALDVILEIAVFGGMALVGVWLFRGWEVSGSRDAAIFLCAAIVPHAIQAASIAQGGQSLGKRVTQTRIVLADGRTAGLFEGFVLRTLPVVVLGLVPWALAMVWRSEEGSGVVWAVLGCWAAIIIDAAMVLGAQRRCLHDRMAGTFVVDAFPRDLRDPPDSLP